jgi:Ca2+-binding EF-hand superfamily protein
MRSATLLMCLFCLSNSESTEDEAQLPSKQEPMPQQKPEPCVRCTTLAHGVPFTEENTRKLFDAEDTDGDGYHSKAETLDAMLRKDHVMSFETIDKNQDGVLDKSEFTYSFPEDEGGADFFKKNDADGDEKLTSGEFFGMHSHIDGDEKGDLNYEGEGARVQMEHQFLTYDKNEDGKLSHTEYHAGHAGIRKMHGEL